MKLLIAVVFVTIAITASDSVAHAEKRGEICWSFDKDNWSYMCIAADYVKGRPDHYHAATARIWLSRNLATASRCVLTFKHTLYANLPHDATSWTVPNRQQDCSALLESSPAWNNMEHSWWGTFTGTSANDASIDACIDLYWGSSTHSGFQVCWFAEPIVSLRP